MNNKEKTENKEASEINNKNEQEQETPTIININSITNNIGETSTTEITREITAENEDIEEITDKEKASTMKNKEQIQKQEEAELRGAEGVEGGGPH